MIAYSPHTLEPKRMRLRIGLCAVACSISCLAVPSLSRAQAQAPPPPPPRSEGTAEAAFVGTSGNSSTSAFGLNGEIIFRPDTWVIQNRAAYVRNRSEGITTAERVLYGSRVEKVHTPKLSSFGEYRFYRDEFAGVSNNQIISGGFAFKVVDTGVHLFTVDGSLGYLHEGRLQGEDIDSASYGGGAFYKWTFSETASFTDEFKLTGLFDNADDWRIGNIAALTAKLTDVLSLKASYALRYANFPVPGFKTTDTTTSIALVAKFSRPR